MFKIELNITWLANQGLEKRPVAFMEERGGDLDHLATFWLGSVVREGENQCLEREGGKLPHFSFGGALGLDSMP